MPTFRATLIAWSSLIALPAIAQPAPAPVAPAAPPGAAPAPVAPPPPGPAPAPAAPEPAPAPLPAQPEPKEPPAPTPPVVEAPAAPVAVAPAEEATPEPEYPDRLSVGKSGGFFQPGALLQFWGFLTHNEDDTTSTFRLRRAELRAKGEIVPKLVGYQVMIDAAKVLRFTTQDDQLVPPGDTSILQDYFITFMSDYADVSLGQFKNPISWEGVNSSSKTLFPERSRVSREYGDRRDVGLRIEKKFGGVFYYHAGFYNGSGQNRVDDDNEKDGALRLEVYPIEGLMLGAMGYATIGTRDEAARDRLEADARYEGNNLIVQAEYIRAWSKSADSDDVTEGHGVYGALGYTILERIQPIVRVGMLDVDLEVDDNTLMHYEGGLNYLLRGHEMKLSLVAGSFVPDTGPHTIEATLAAQVSY